MARSLCLLSRHIEPMPLNTQSGVESCPVVLPGDNGGHLDNLAGVEMIGELFDQCSISRGWRGRKAFGVFESQTLVLSKLG